MEILVGEGGGMYIKATFGEIWGIGSLLKRAFTGGCVYHDKGKQKVSGCTEVSINKIITFMNDQAQTS